MKPCRDCGQEKALEDFQRYWSKKVQEYRYSSMCKPCRSIHRRGPAGDAERKRDNARRRKQYAEDLAYRELVRERNWLGRYGIGVDQIIAMLDAQGGKCAICRTSDPGAKTWHIDHDHRCCDGVKTCGKCIRGLLCTRCNTGIGMLQDDPDCLMSAVAYLLSFKSVLGGEAWPSTVAIEGPRIPQ